MDMDLSVVAGDLGIEIDGLLLSITVMDEVNVVVSAPNTWDYSHGPDGTIFHSVR